MDGFKLMVLPSVLRIHKSLSVRVYVSVRRNEGQRPKDRKGERPIKPLICFDHEKMLQKISFWSVSSRER